MIHISITIPSIFKPANLLIVGKELRMNLKSTPFSLITNNKHTFHSSQNSEYTLTYR